MTIRKTISAFPTKHNIGFTSEEIDSMLKKHYPQIDYGTFAKALGTVTCQTVEGKIVYYHCDVELAITCVLQNRKPTSLEFD